jgi:hypothetical protein
MEANLGGSCAFAAFPVATLPRSGLVIKYLLKEGMGRRSSGRGVGWI